MKKEAYQEYISEHEQELAELVRRIARIPAPTGKEEQRALFCLKWLREHGADEAYLDRAGNVIFPYHMQMQGERLPVQNTGLCAEDFLQYENNPVIVFDAHLDVVFPDETELPFREDETRMYCPGVGDDTANLAVLLMLAAYVAEVQPDTGKYGILFVCSVGEEGLGNLKGVREICAEFGSRMELFCSFDLTMDAYTSRAVGSLRYRIEVQTEGGHSYQCFGRPNANVELAKLIQRLYEVQVPERGKTTYNIGMISGGTSVNTIAQKAEMLYEIRSDHTEDLKELRREFEYIMKECGAEEGSDFKNEWKTGTESTCRITVTLIGERPCEDGVDEVRRRTLFQKTESVTEAVTGTVPEPVPCSTNCNIPLSMGIPSVCIGLCRGAGAHTREEYIEKDSLMQGMQIALGMLYTVLEG